MLNVGDDVILDCRLINYERASDYVKIEWMFTSSDGSQPRTYLWESGKVLVRYLQYQRYTTRLNVGPAMLNSSGTYSCISYNNDFADAVFANATVKVFRECMCMCMCIY